MSRIYVVNNGPDAHLVRANNRSQAIRHVAEKTMKVEVASQESLVTMITAGAKIQDATADVEDGAL